MDQIDSFILLFHPLIAPLPFLGKNQSRAIMAVRLYVSLPNFVRIYLVDNLLLSPVLASIYSKHHCVVCHVKMYFCDIK